MSVAQMSGWCRARLLNLEDHFDEWAAFCWNMPAASQFHYCPKPSRNFSKFQSDLYPVEITLECRPTQQYCGRIAFRIALFAHWLVRTLESMQPSKAICFLRYFLCRFLCLPWTPNAVNAGCHDACSWVVQSWIAKKGKFILRQQVLASRPIVCGLPGCVIIAMLLIVSASLKPQRCNFHPVFCKWSFCKATRKKRNVHSVVQATGSWLSMSRCELKVWIIPAATINEQCFWLLF